VPAGHGRRRLCRQFPFWHIASRASDLRNGRARQRERFSDEGGNADFPRRQGGTDYRIVMSDRLALVRAFSVATSEA
jgi:hypothetical protein